MSDTTGDHDLGDSTSAPRRDAVRDRILDVAERMFAHQSFASVSIRTVTAEAGVNLAAVNYYFGSKAGLLKAVFLRRAIVLNRERLGLLQAVMAQHGPDDRLPLEAVLRALLVPPIRWLFDPDQGLGVFIHFIARCQVEEEPELKALFYQDVEHLRRFVPALSRALPQLSEAEVHWRLHFALGAMHYTFSHLERLGSISKGICNIGDEQAVVDHMISFCKAGFEAA